MVCRAVNEGGETYESLSKAPISYLLKLDEYLETNRYINYQMERAKAQKEKEMLKNNRR